MREQTEQLKREAESFTQSMKKMSNEKNALANKLGHIENEKSAADDAFCTLSLWLGEARDQLRNYKEQLETKAENLVEAGDRLEREQRKNIDLQHELHVVRTERDSLYKDKKSLQVQTADAEQRAKVVPRTLIEGAAIQTEEVQERGGTEAKQQQTDSTVEEQAFSQEEGEAFEKLAFLAQARVFAADLKSYLQRLTALTTVPS